MLDDVHVFYCRSCEWCSNINIHMEENVCPSCKATGTIVKFVGEAEEIGALIKSILLEHSER